MNSAGLTNMDAIAAVKTYDFGSPLDELPLRNYTQGTTYHNSNLIHPIWIKVMPQVLAITHPAANTVHIQGVGVANATYQLQTSTSPAGSGFTTSVNVMADSTGNISYDDTSAGTKKFYRLAIP